MSTVTHDTNGLPSVIPRKLLKRNAAIRMKMLDETIYSLAERYDISHMTVSRRWSARHVNVHDVCWLSLALHVPTWALLSEDPCDVGRVGVPPDEKWKEVAKRYMDQGTPYPKAEEIWFFEHDVEEG